MLAVLWRLRYKLSFRDVAELLSQRGFVISYETIRTWEFRFAPLVSENLRSKRRGTAGVSWYLDETYIKVGGQWRYLYRAIDRDGNLLDSMLGEHRDKHAARRFLRRLLDSAGQKPLRLTTDKHPAYKKDSLDRRSQGAAPAEPVSEQPDGAESPADKTALLPDAWVRTVRISEPFLYSVRRVTQLFESSKAGRGASFSIRQTTDLYEQMVDSDGGVGCMIPGIEPVSTCLHDSLRPEF